MFQFCDSLDFEPLFLDTYPLPYLLITFLNLECSNIISVEHKSYREKKRKSNVDIFACQLDMEGPDIDKRKIALWFYRWGIF